MKRLLGVIALFAVINGVLYGVQKLSRSDEEALIEDISNRLDELTPIMESLEKELSLLDEDLGQMHSSITSLESDILQYELRYPDGIPSSLYGDYISKIQEYNSLIDPFNLALNEFNDKYVEYEGYISNYNRLVDDANELGKKVGGYWVLFPDFSSLVP